jgi:uncharacterized protein YggE
LTATVTTHGHGEVSVVPDAVHLDLAAECTAEGVSDALSAARATAGALRVAIHDCGVADGDIRTSGLTVWQRTDDSGRPQGYTATESVGTLLRDLDAVDAVIAAATDACGDALRVHGIQLVVTDPGDALARARETAVADARRAAQTYSAAVGATVGEVLRIVDGAAANPLQPKAFGARLAAEGGFAPGTQAVTADVTVEWALA